MKDRIFGVLQRVGRSFMLPIALLPVAGLLLGIGSSFTNPTTLEAYGLSSFIYEGSFIYTILDIMNRTGSVVFDNLPLLFAVGVAIGMAKAEKDVAALSGAIGFLIMNASISTLIMANGGISALPPNTTTTSLGITTLQTGVFGGIVIGLITAALHNRFYKIKLPAVLSFFGGTRFVPIITSLVCLLVGVLMFFVWPIVQTGISTLGNLVLKSGYIGTWIYGITERALIPFGLHHVFYMPFWQTELGGSAVIDGEVIQGAQNIFFAELASKSTEQFSVSATRFMSGKFPFMIFGLPAAAFAMYRAAAPEKRKLAGGLLLSAALTSMLTGITEPIEFTFLFVAPLMYVVHCVLAGLSYMLMHIFNVGVGMTFSGGLIDLTLFGILQGNAKTNWIWIVIIGLIYAVIYYFVFYFMITKLHLKTPGREDEGEETKLYTRKDMAKKESGISALILSGLGGADNISDIDSCATRLRVTVKNPDLCNKDMLSKSGAKGVIIKGNGIQAVYGPQVSVIKSELLDFLEKGDIKTVSDIIYSPIKGKAVPLSEVRDEAFKTEVLGKGAAIIPYDNNLYSPTSGVVKTIAETGHAISILSDNGAEILLHIGIDTVKLKGRYFEPKVKNNQKIKKGDLLITFDLESAIKEGFDMTIPVVICNYDEFKDVEILALGEINQSDDFMKLN